MCPYIRTVLRSLTCTAPVVFVLAGFVFAVEPSASATTPAPINFTTTVQPVNEPSPCPGFPVVVEGASVASGVITDTFTVKDCTTFGHNTLHTQRSLQSTNNRGTIGLTIDAKGVPSAATPTSLTFIGTWAIVSRSGAYATLEGQGDFTAKVDLETDVSQETESGQAHFN
jgi:hypothetical protein